MTIATQPQADLLPQVGDEFFVQANFRTIAEIKELEAQVYWIVFADGLKGQFPLDELIKLEDMPF